MSQHDMTDLSGVLNSIDGHIERHGGAPETKSVTPGTRSAPSRTPPSLDERLVRAVERQNVILETRSAVPVRRAEPVTPAAGTVTPAKVRQRIEKSRALLELRQTAERNAMPGRRDVINEEKQARINGAMDGHDADELARLRRENADLRRKSARPPAQVQGAGAPGLSQRSVAFAMYRKGMLNYLRTGQETISGKHLRELQDACIKLDGKAFDASVNAEGGYFVQPEQDTGPIERLLNNLSPMRQLATVRTISAATFKTRVNRRGQTARWVGEMTATAADSTPNFSELEFPAMTLLSEPEATQEALEDAAIDVEQLLSEEAQYEFAEAESAAYVAGDGQNKPKGFLGYSFVANSSWVWGSIGYLATGTDGAFAASGPADVVMRLPLEMRAAYRQNATWLMNRSTIGTVRTLKASDGHYLWKEGSIADKVPNSLAGHVVSEDEQMPSIASGAHALAFGDWARGYLIVDRLGFQAFRNPYINPPYVRFHLRKRVGGGVKVFDAIKTIRFATS